MESLLRDIDRERGKMQDNLANLERHYQKLHGYVQQYVRQAVIEWARLIVSHPASTLLIVETTKIIDENGYAYGNEAEPIRFTSLSLSSGEVWDQLLSPSRSRGVAGTEYHGLRQADLIGKPRLADAWPGIVKALSNRQLVIFGADYAREAFQSDLLKDAFCLQSKAKEFYGEFYGLSLEKVFRYQGLDVNRDDVRDSRDRLPLLAVVVRNLAAGMKKQEPESELADGELGDLEDHPF